MDLIQTKLKNRYLVITILYTLIFGILVHGFCFANADFSHDSIFEMKGIDENVLFTRGRFISPIIFRMNSLALPWFNGIVSLLILGLTFYFIFDLLEIRNEMIKLFVCGWVLVDRALITLISTYIHDIVCYSISALFAVLSVWTFCKTKKLRPLSILFLVLSLGIYQTYVQVAVILFVAYIISNLMRNKDFKRNIIDAFLYVIILAVSMVCYFVIYKVILATGKYVDTVPTWKNHPTNALVSSWEDCLARLKMVFTCEKNYFMHLSGDNSKLAMILVCVLVLISIIMFIFVWKRNKLQLKSVGVITLLVALLPLEAGFIIFLANLSHDAMCGHFSYICLISACIVQVFLELTEKNNSNKKNIITTVAVISVAIFLLNNSMFANRVYLKKNLEEKATLSLMTRVIDRVEQLDGYVVGETKVVIIGSVAGSRYSVKNDAFDYSGVAVFNSYSVTYAESVKAYINDYMNYPMNISFDYDTSYASFIKDMPSFPAKDSVQIIDGIVFVKLS